MEEKTPHSSASGRLLVLAAAILWSTSGLFAKANYFDDWSESYRSCLFSFWRAFFAMIALGLLVRRPKFSPLMLPMVLLYVLMNYTFLQAMITSEAASVIWLQYTSPAWVFLGSYFLFREKIVRRDLILLAFSAVGIGIILSGELRNASLVGALLSLVSGITYAGVVLCLRHMRHIESAWLITVNQLATVIAFAPFLFISQIWPSPGQAAVMAAFGIFQMGGAYMLFAMGVKRISGHEASGIVLLEPILLPLWVWLAWRHAPTYEAPHWWTYLGGSFILCGLAVRYLLPNRNRKS